MDIDDLFDGIAKAFRRYQQEIVEQKGTLYISNPAGLEPEEKVEKTGKKVATEKRINQYLPKPE